MSSGMLQTGIPLPSGRRRSSTSIRAAPNVNPFYYDTNNNNNNNIRDGDNNNKSFVSQIPTPFFSSSQPVANPNNQSGNMDSRRRRNSVGSTVSDMNRSFLTNDEEPRRKKSKSTTANDTSPQRYRRNSTTSGTRKSLQPNFNTSMINNSSFINGKKDPRPLRDKNFQNAIQQEILDYLLNNKIDIQTNHPVSLKSLRQPTQKGFTIIFAWLYKRLDPGYVFQKSVEVELYQILRNLNYPYLETINKSQISAVGGSSWPKFLGLLHWLVKLNEKMDKISQDLDLSLLNQPTQEMIQMHQPIPDSLDQQDKIKSKYESMIESLVIEYTMDAYKCFLNSNDDFSTAMSKFQIGYEKFIKVIELDIQVLENQNETILQRYDQILQKAQKLRYSKERFTKLQSDVNEVQNYVTTMNEKSQKWPIKLENIKADQEKTKKEVDDVEKEIRTLLNDLDSKNVSVELIESKNNKKEIILQSLEDIADKSDKMIANLQAKRIDNKTVVKNLLNVLDRYNQALQSTMTDRLALTGRNILSVEDFKIDIANTLQNLNDDTKLDYYELFNHKGDEQFSLKSYITEKLIKLLEDIENNCNVIQADIDELYVDISSLQDEVRVKSEDTKNTREKASDVQSEIHSLKLQYEKTLSGQISQIDELTRKNMNTHKMIDKRLADARQQLSNKKQSLVETENELIKQKEKLQNKIFDIVDYILNFKTKIQDSLEDTEKVVKEELEKLNLT